MQAIAQELAVQTSECLPTGKEKLEMIDALICPEPDVFGLSALNESVDISFASKKPWRVDAIREIHPNRSHKRPITNAKTNPLDHVVEVLHIPLVEAERKGRQRGKKVSGVHHPHA